MIAMITFKIRSGKKQHDSRKLPLSAFILSEWLKVELFFLSQYYKLDPGIKSSRTRLCSILHQVVGIGLPIYNCSIPGNVRCHFDISESVGVIAAV
jgi:hypothetical protein